MKKPILSDRTFDGGLSGTAFEPRVPTEVDDPPAHLGSAVVLSGSSLRTSAEPDGAASAGREDRY